MGGTNAKVYEDAQNRNKPSITEINEGAVVEGNVKRLSPLPIKGVGCAPPWEATEGFKLPRKHQILEASNCSVARGLRTGPKAGKQGSCCVP